MSASLTERAAGLRQTRVQIARENFAAFVEFVMRDESSGGRIRLAPMHEEWCELLMREDRLVLQAHIEAGKSAILSVAWPLWLLGRNPALRIAIVSGTHQQSVKLVRAIAQYMTRSPELQKVFPHLKPGSPWAPDSGRLTVQRSVTSKDLSVQGFGRAGAVIGARLDVLIIDDIEDWDSTRSETGRESTWSWTHNTLFSRLTQGARVCVAATSYHPRDLVNRLSADPGWSAHRYPIELEDGTPRWPERWPKERIERARQTLGPFEAARQLDLVVRSDDEAVIQEAWIQTALARGDGGRVYTHVPYLGDGQFVTIGCDLGIGLSKKNDLTALTAVLTTRDQRELLNVEAFRAPIDVIAEKIESWHRRYQADRVCVESVQAQAFLVDLVRRTKNIPCTGFKTGAGKMSLAYQAELLGHELSRARWRIPNVEGRMEPEIRRLVDEMLAFTPNDHCGDRFASLLFARWAAAASSFRAESGRLDFISR